MTEAVLTTKDLMNISITVAVIVLTIILSVALIHAILIMRDVRKVSMTVGELTEKFHQIILAPLNLLGQITPQADKAIKKWLKDKESKK